MFLKRSYKKEIMDDFEINDERIDTALKELKIINKYLGGKSVSKEGLKKIQLNMPGKKQIKILDAGSGASDILLSMGKNNLQIFAADLNKRVTKFLKINSPEVNVICADVQNFPFKYKQFDIIHLSLFFHHFTEEEIKKLIPELIKAAKSGIIINDLHRSVLAFVGIKILTMLFSKSKMVKNDGPLSVKRGFKKNELMKILESFGVNYEMNYKWAFRWLVVIYCN